MSTASRGEPVPRLASSAKGRAPTDRAARRRTPQPALSVPGSGSRQATRHRPADLAATVIASVSIALPLLFYLNQHVELLRQGYRIESLRERRADLVERRRELRARRAAEARLSRVEQAAVSQGLVAPEPEDVFRIVDEAPARGGADETSDRSD